MDMLKLDYRYMKTIIVGDELHYLPYTQTHRPHSEDLKFKLELFQMGHSA